MQGLRYEHPFGNHELTEGRIGHSFAVWVVIGAEANHMSQFAAVNRALLPPPEFSRESIFSPSSPMC